MSLVLGKDYVFYANVGGIWRGYMCARSGSFNLNTEFIETTVTGSGDGRSFEPTVYDFTGSIDGVASLNETDLTEDQLLSLQLAKTKLLCRFVQTSQAGDTFLKQAYFYIQSYTDTGSFDGIATFSVSLRGTGLLTISATPPSPNNGEVFRYPATGSVAPATEGSLTWLATGLGNKNILDVVKDGRGQNNIITSGTPVNNEVLYETIGADGQFTFALPFEPNETPPFALYQNL